MEVQAHLRIALAELADHVRQHVARLGVGGADREASLPLVAQLRREVADALGLLQDLQRPLDHLLPGGGDAGEIAPLAHEDLKAQLVLQELDLLAHPRLRGVEFVRRGRDIEPALGDGGEVAQLVELHAFPRLTQPPPFCDRSITGAQP